MNTEKFEYCMCSFKCNITFIFILLNNGKIPLFDTREKDKLKIIYISLYVYIYTCYRTAGQFFTSHRSVKGS